MLESQVYLALALTMKLMSLVLVIKAKSLTLVLYTVYYQDNLI